ncbi:MAG: carbon-nitrogen hydrolase family protein [Chloroflexota bacterium]
MNKVIKEIRTIRVAAVQVESRPGQIAANHAHVMPFIETAVSQGAQLVILPELFACGYIPNPTVWRYGESLAGQTVQWLRATAQRLGIYLGAGFAEVDGGDFYNSFALATPAGKLAGCARKTVSEAYSFRYGRGRHLITTGIGQIGIGICADNHFTAFPRLMQRSGIDLLLMPHASPLPYKTAKLITAADIDRARENLLSIPTLYARLLGVPVLFANALGDLQPMSGLFGKLMDPALFRLLGLSRIVDGDGTLRGELGHEEGVLVAEVSLGAGFRQEQAPPDYGGWLHPGSALVRRALRPVDLALARVYYAFSRQRRRQARRLMAHESIKV